MNIIKFHMKKRIEKICGVSENIPNFQEIENSPNFVFPDESFETITLFDKEGNVVNLNSWLDRLLCKRWLDKQYFRFLTAKNLCFLFIVNTDIL